MANENEMTASHTHVPQISRVGLKLPPIWKNNIKLWFIQVESNLEIAGITLDQTKYNTLVASIDSESLSTVSDILLNPPAQNRYDVLKSRLISEFSDSENRQIRKLLSELQLGDEKPSQLLRKMRALANNSITDDFLRNLWLQRLPAEIQTILSVSSETLDNLAQLADKIAEVRSDPLGACAMSRDLPSKTKSLSEAQFPQPAVIVSLQADIDSLRKQIERLSRQKDRNHFTQRRNKSPFRKNSRHRSSGSPRQHSNFCFYHATFGRNARNCKAPCSFKETSEPQGN